MNFTEEMFLKKKKKLLKSLWHKLDLQSQDNNTAEADVDMCYSGGSLRVLWKDK